MFNNFVYLFPDKLLISRTHLDHEHAEASSCVRVRKGPSVVIFTKVNSAMVYLMDTGGKTKMKHERFTQDSILTLTKKLTF